MTTFILLLVALMLCSVAALAQDNPLKCLQKPIAWMVGQQTRIVIQTPANCGQLQVLFPSQLVLFDRWPWRRGDTEQRFYFRAQAPLATGKLSFHSGAYTLEVPIQVLTWAQALQPRQFENWKLPRVFPMDGADQPKQGLTFLTPDDLKKLRQAGLPHAAALLKSLPSDEQLYHLMPETTIPRAPMVQYAYGEQMGCPVCGKKIFRHNPFYPWKIDPIHHPWKVGCPDCGRWFPSNNFAAGDMHSGAYPDDGWGWRKPGDPWPYCFIAYYAEWAYVNNYTKWPGTLCDAYARTGDRRFGHAAAIVFCRIAEQYLNLALNLNQRKSYMREAVWHGKIIPQSHLSLYDKWLYMQDNWETQYADKWSRAFEMLWSYFDQDDPQLLAFLHAHHHPELKTMADVRRFIETGYFRVFAQACLDRSIIGNLPQGQCAAIDLALFLNSPRSPEIVNWVFNGPGAMRYFPVNNYFIDGSGNESPGYNTIHTRDLEGFAEVLEKLRRLRPRQYPESKFPSLFASRKYLEIWKWWLNFNLIGRTYANVGDTGGVTTTNPLPPNQTGCLSSSLFVKPYEVTHDPQFAQVLWDPRIKAPLAAVTDPAMRAAITRVVAERGWQVEQPSNLLDGFGHAILRSGTGDNRRALWLRYGRQRGHNHDDMLTIGYAARERSVLPELGYPRSFSARTRGPWDANWATHYCGRVVPGGNYLGRGHCRLFADGPWARVATAYSPAHQNVGPPEVAHLLPQFTMERTVALIDLDAVDSYIVDIFRLGGGTDHYWSFHGPQYDHPAAVSGLQLTPQEKGTLAGENVAWGDQAAFDKWQKAHPILEAFAWMYGVQKARTRDAWSLDWALRGYSDLHLRMTDLPDRASDVWLTRGKPPGGGTPYELEYAITHTRGRQPYHDTNVEVMDFYQGACRLTDVKRLPVNSTTAGDFPPVAVQVQAGDRTDTVIVSRQARLCEAGGVTTDALFAVWSESGGELQRVYLVGGTVLKKGDLSLQLPAAEWRGEITACDYKHRQVTIRPAAPYPRGLVGRYVRFTNDFSDCSHLITAAENQGGATVLTLELDPRIGEGPVAKVADGMLVSGVKLILGSLCYYHGKTLTNEDHTARYRLAGVEHGDQVWIDQSKHGVVPADKLAAQFTDRDGDGLKRFIIYDYGVGDTARVPYSVSLQRVGSGWRLEAPVPVTMQLPR